MKSWSRQAWDLAAHGRDLAGDDGSTLLVGLGARDKLGLGTLREVSAPAPRFCPSESRVDSSNRGCLAACLQYLDLYLYLSRVVRGLKTRK